VGKKRPQQNRKCHISYRNNTARFINTHAKPNFLTSGSRYSFEAEETAGSWIKARRLRDSGWFGTLLMLGYSVQNSMENNMCTKITSKTSLSVCISPSARVSLTAHTSTDHTYKMSHSVLTVVTV